MSATPRGKSDLRRASQTSRRARSAVQREAAAEAIALHASSLPALVRARRVAAYLSMPSEPGTGPMLRLLADRGVEVIVPRSLPDHTLAWVRWDPAAPTTMTALGIPEPAGDALGPDALATVDLVLVPALAVDHAGGRLGRGAGYYDRALEGLSLVRCAVVYSDELHPVVPTEPHDVPVDLVLTEAGVFRPERTVS